MAGSAFSSAFGGGLGVGSGLADIFFEGKNRRKLGQLEQLFKSGDYNNAGAMLAGMGQVGQGVNTLNIPYERQQQELQRDFQNQTFMNQKQQQEIANRMAAERLGMDRDRFNAQMDPNSPLNVGSGPTYGKNPEYFTDPQTGETVLGVVGDDGTLKRLDTGGLLVAPGYEKVDAGTHFELRNKRNGTVTSIVPKQNFQEAFDTKSGTLTANSVNENRSELSSMQSKMGGLREVVKELEVLSDKATFTKAGQIYDEGLRQMGRDPTPGGIARTEYIAKVDNQVLPLLRDTFGAAFTVKEGETLRATLGDPNKSPSEKKAVLKAFIDQKERNVLAAASKNLGTVSPLTPTNGPREVVNVPSPQNAGASPQNAIPVSSESELDDSMIGKYVTINGQTFKVEAD